MKKSKKKKLIAEIILIVALVIFVISVIFNIGDPEAIWSAIKGAKYRYFAAAILTLAIYIVVYSISMIILAKSSKVKVKTNDLFLISSCEFFFNGITPGAVGGQPFQVFAYNQLGVPASKSTGIILSNFLCTMFAQLIISLVSLAFYPLILQYAPQMQWVFWLGFIVNTCGTVFFVSLGVSKHIRNAMIKIVNWFCNRKFMKKHKNASLKFEKYITDAQIAFSECWKNKFAFFMALFSKVCAYAILYSIPFFILKALNLPVGHAKGEIDATMIFEIICITSFAMMAGNYIPTPGAAGFLEFAFMYFFLPIIIQTGDTVTVAEQATASAGVLLWRVVTYYILMIFSLIDYFIFVKKKHITYTGEDNEEYTTNNEVTNETNDLNTNTVATEESTVDSTLTSEEITNSSRELKEDNN